jgi:hypothetical protein
MAFFENSWHTRETNTDIGNVHSLRIIYLVLCKRTAFHQAYEATIKQSRLLRFLSTVRNRQKSSFVLRCRVRNTPRSPEAPVQLASSVVSLVTDRSYTITGLTSAGSFLASVTEVRSM